MDAGRGGGEVLLPAGKRALIPTGIAIALPVGTKHKSGPQQFSGEIWGDRLNAPGTIDQDYRGEIKVLITMARTGFKLNGATVLPSRVGTGCTGAWLSGFPS